MAAGSNMPYFIHQEKLCPEGELGAKRSSGSYSRYVSGLSRFDVEDQAGLTLREYARGLYRSSVKRSC
jgi:hypothetical protein